MVPGGIEARAGWLESFRVRVLNSLEMLRVQPRRSSGFPEVPVTTNSAQAPPLPSIRPRVGSDGLSVEVSSPPSRNSSGPTALYSLRMMGLEEGRTLKVKSTVVESEELSVRVI